MKDKKHICPICKKPVLVPAWKYCSDECGYEARRRRDRIRSHKNREKLKLINKK